MSITLGQQALASDMNTTVPIGVPLPFFGSSAYLPPDHLICDGNTIGDTSSGATARANVDTQTLFTLLWNSIANTELTIQNSSGSQTSRGASAAADFGAHKRMPLPDLRAYTLGGYKVGDANFGTLGKAVGEATHQLTVAELASHTHSGANYATNGASSTNNGWPNASAGPTGSAGSNTPHNNVQPTMTVNWIIRYKSYA